MAYSVNIREVYPSNGPSRANFARTRELTLTEGLERITGRVILIKTESGILIPQDGNHTLARITVLSPDQTINLNNHPIGGKSVAELEASLSKLSIRLYLEDYYGFLFLRDRTVLLGINTFTDFWSFATQGKFVSTADYL